MIDTHFHLTDPRLLEQIDGVLHRARSAGVNRMITIGTTLDDDAAAVAVCRGRPFLRCAVGVHPNHAHEVPVDRLPELRQIQADPAVVALGEMGLDYFHNFGPRARQLPAFEFQLNLAVEVNKPVVIHAREAIADTLAVMKAFPTVRAVFHCFTGTPAEARAILDRGYMISFTGALTYKKADGIRESLRLCPRDRVMIETDAPWLSPEPMRKVKANEPALVVHVADYVAREWGTTAATVGRVTTANADAFFGHWPGDEPYGGEAGDA